MRKKEVIENIPIQHHYTKVKGALIHYVTTGEGPIILLVHSWNNDWFGFVPLLKELKGFQVVALDLPGYGGSGDGFAKYSVSIMADVVAGFIDTLKITPAITCGISMGAGVTLDFGARYPEKTKSIIAMGAPVLKDAWVGAKIYAFLMRTGNLNFITRRVGKKIVSNYHYGHLTAKHLNLHNYSKELVDRYGLNGRGRNNPKTLFNMSVSMTKFDAVAALKKAQVPTHLVFGRYDKLVDINKAIATSKKNKFVTVELIDDAGHVVILEKPRESAEAIHTFKKKKAQKIAPALRSIQAKI